MSDFCTIDRVLHQADTPILCWNLCRVDVQFPRQYGDEFLTPIPQNISHDQNPAGDAGRERGAFIFDDGERCVTIKSPAKAAATIKRLS